MSANQPPTQPHSPCPLPQHQQQSSFYSIPHNPSSSSPSQLSVQGSSCNQKSQHSEQLSQFVSIPHVQTTSQFALFQQAEIQGGKQVQKGEQNEEICEDEGLLEENSKGELHEVRVMEGNGQQESPHKHHLHQTPCSQASSVSQSQMLSESEYEIEYEDENQWEQDFQSTKKKRKILKALRKGQKIVANPKTKLFSKSSKSSKTQTILPLSSESLSLNGKENIQFQHLRQSNSVKRKNIKRNKISKRKLITKKKHPKKHKQNQQQYSVFNSIENYFSQ